MSAVAVVDLTAGPGEAAKAALVTKRPYLGLCLTEHHVSLLYRHLVHWTLGEMGSEGSPLYNVKYAEHVGKATTGGHKATGDGQGGAPTGAKGLPNEEAAKRQKPQQRKKKQHHESETSGGETSEHEEKSKAKKKLKGHGKKKRKISSSEEDSRSEQ